MAATQIENGLFRDIHRGDLLVAFHSRAEYLHTLAAGLLAFGPAGALLAANAQARFLLQGLPVSAGRHFQEIFRTGLARFRDAAQEGDRQRLEDRMGSVFAARLESVRRSGRATASTCPAAPSQPTAGFVAHDTAFAAMVHQVEAAAARRVPILIRGETGTGKEQLARHAHGASARRGAFVPVNCAALPDGLVEAELFGHADGAFTGARRGGAPGLVVEADGGTLFLDEIGEMKRELQSVLLRLLDDWTLRPVGGGRSRRVDVLLVAATNIDLEEAVATGRFRADLYYRLNTLEVTLPPLRERADFAAIVEHLLASIAPASRIAAETMAALRARPWPGNIRELRSVLTRLTLCDPSALIGPDALEDMPAARAPLGHEAPPRLREVLRDRIAATHRASGGNVSEAARRLGVSRNTVYRALDRSPR
jgi:transcriptional regulator of acetoin/glycerol metabolism